MPVSINECQGDGADMRNSLYVLCELVFSDNKRLERSISENDIRSCVADIVAQLHGDYGITVVKLSLNVKYLNTYTNTVMIRCPREFHHLVTSSLPMVKKIGAYEAQFRSLHLAGSIRLCQKFLIKYSKAALRSLVNETSNKEELDLIKKIVMDSFMVDAAQQSGRTYHTKQHKRLRPSKSRTVNSVNGNTEMDCVNSDKS